MIGNTYPGKQWEGALVVSDGIDPNQNFEVDPYLPILGRDPKFPTDEIVIARGRLVGIKRDVTVNTDITSGKQGVSFITPADGVTIPPLGFANSNMFKRWTSRMTGPMPIISTGKMIQLPYVAALNGYYGSLQPGDAVTALKSIDPRKMGAVVKYLPYRVSEVTGDAGDVTLVSVPYQTLFTPTILAAWDSGGTLVASPTATFESAAWKCKTTGVTRVLFSFGQYADMIAGSVWGMESINNMPGFLKWVSGESGYLYGDLWPSTTNGTAVSSATPKWAATTGLLALTMDSTTIKATKIDASKAITITVTADVYILQSDGTYSQASEGYTLPQNSGDGADYTMGANYQVNPINGTISFFGLAVDANGTAITGVAGESASMFSVSYTAEANQSVVGLGQGIAGLTDGETYHEGTPLWLTKDKITGVASVGMMRVLIR